MQNNLRLRKERASLKDEERKLAYANNEPTKTDPDGYILSPKREDMSMLMLAKKLREQLATSNKKNEINEDIDAISIEMNRSRDILSVGNSSGIEDSHLTDPSEIPDFKESIFFKTNNPGSSSGEINSEKKISKMVTMSESVKDHQNSESPMLELNLQRKPANATATDKEPISRRLSSKARIVSVFQAVANKIRVEKELTMGHDVLSPSPTTSFQLGRERVYFFSRKF